MQIVNCQVDEVLSPDYQMTAVNNLDDFANSILNNIPVDYNLHEIEGIDSKTVNNDRIDTNTIVNDEDLPSVQGLEEISINPSTNDHSRPLDENLSKNIISFGLEDYGIHKIDGFEATVKQNRAKRTPDLFPGILIERPSKTVLTFGLDDFDTHEDVEENASITTKEPEIINDDSYPSLKDLIKGPNTAERDNLDKTIEVDSPNIRFGEIMNIESNIEDVENKDDNNYSEISKRNFRKAFNANQLNPPKKKATDLRTIQREIYEEVLGEEYRPKDFSKSVFSGVPMNMMLTMLRKYCVLIS